MNHKSHPLNHRWWYATLVFLAAAATCGPARATDEATAKAVFEHTLRGTAFISNPVKKVKGTGWVLSQADRLLITNYKVVAGATRVTVVFPASRNGQLVTDRAFYDKHDVLQEQGLLVEGHVLHADSRRDLAVVRLEKLPPDAVALDLAGEPASLAERIHTVADPAGKKEMWIHEQGVVRQTDNATYWLRNGQFFAARIIETSFAMKSDRDAGSPVVNDAGQIVGVASAYNASGNSVTSCIDLQAVKEYQQVVDGLLRPRTALDQRRIGDRHVVEKNWPSAEKAYREALALNPKAACLYTDLAGTLFHQGQHKEGEEALDQAGAGGDKFAKVWKELGGGQGTLGPVVGPEWMCSPFGAVRTYRNGMIFYWSNGKLRGQAFAVTGIVAQKYVFPDLQEYLGFPVGNEEPAPPSPLGTTGRCQRFTRGAITVHSEGLHKNEAYIQRGVIAALHEKMGGSGSKLGFPLGDDIAVAEGVRQNFEGGYVLVTKAAGAKAFFNDPAAAGPKTSTPTPPESDARAVYERALRSTAYVRNPVVNGNGTGWIVNEADRLLITNWHVANKATKVHVVFPAYENGHVVAERTYYFQNRFSIPTETVKKQGLAVEGRVLYGDYQRDLAMIQLEKLPAGIVALDLAKASAAAGDRLHCVGNPGAAQGMWIYTQGPAQKVIDQRGEHPIMRFHWCWLLDTTLPGNHGDSGSAVLNDAGQVVGVVSFSNKCAGDLHVYCIEVQAVKEFLTAANGVVRPKTGADYYHIGDRYVFEQNWPEAEKAYREAIRLNPRDAFLYMDLAGTLFRQDKQTEAQQALDQAVAAGDKMAKVWKDLGGEQGVLGPLAGSLYQDCTAGSVRGCEHGAMFTWSSGKLAGQTFTVQGDIAKKYAFPQLVERLGFPLGNEGPASTVVKSRDPATTRGMAGRNQHFERGAIMQHGDGVHKGEVFITLGAIGTLYKSMGGNGSKLGLPLSDEISSNGGGRQNFEGGYIVWTPKDGAKAVLNAVLASGAK